jgi:UDP-N-acetylmuramate dehydrogenase
VKHSLVFVNLGGATGAEILELAREVQDAVRARFGIELEPEPRII